MLKELLAPQECVVTPSKLLIDDMGTAREVDVVAEIEVDGHVFTQSYEVVGRQRPTDISWVEQIIAKHESLPTDRLFLVSWSGFTKDALRKARGRSRVIPVEVRSVEGESHLLAEYVQLELISAAPLVQVSDDSTHLFEAAPDTGLYGPSGKLQVTVYQLGSWVLRRPKLGEALLTAAHGHPRREEMTWIEFDAPLEQPPLSELHVRMDGSAEQRLVWGIRLRASVAFTWQRIDLSIQSFGEKQAFGHGELALGGVHISLLHHWTRNSLYALSPLSPRNGGASEDGKMFPKPTADLAKRRKSLASEVASAFHDFSKAVFREGALPATTSNSSPSPSRT